MTGRALKIVDVPKAAERVLQAHFAMGGVVRYVFFSVTDRDAELESLHREAAIETAIELTCRDFGHGKSRDQSARRLRAAIPVGADAPKGHALTVRSFLGPFCNTERRVHIPRSYSIQGATDGYGYAFANPPYGLVAHLATQPRAASSDEINQLFSETLAIVFASFPEDVSIYQWSTEWSKWFDSGREWWGTFLWTVYLRSTQQLIGVAAAATD